MKKCLDEDANRFIFIFTNKNINDKIGIERGE